MCEQRGVRGHLLEDVGRLLVSAWLELEPDTMGLLGEFGRQDLVDDAVAGVTLVEWVVIPSVQICTLGFGF